MVFLSPLILTHIQYRCAFSSNLSRIFNCALSSHLSKVFKPLSIQQSTVTELFRSVAAHLGERSPRDAPESTRRSPTNRHLVEIHDGCKDTRGDEMSCRFTEIIAKKSRIDTAILSPYCTVSLCCIFRK